MTVEIAFGIGVGLITVDILMLQLNGCKFWLVKLTSENVKHKKKKRKQNKTIIIKRIKWIFQKQTMKLLH